MSKQALDDDEDHYEWPSYPSQDLKTPFWPGSHADDDHSSSEESSDHTKNVRGRACSSAVRVSEHWDQPYA